jgi:hypothetical protein
MRLERYQKAIPNESLPSSMLKECLCDEMRCRAKWTPDRKPCCLFMEKEKQNLSLYGTHPFIHCYQFIYRPIHPPSTVSTSPLTYALAALPKKTTAPLKSSGAPHLPAGIRLNMLSALFSSLINASFISVAIYPGAIAFTLTPLLAHSFDSALVSCPTPPLLAAYAGTVIPPWKVSSEATFIMLPRRPSDRSAGCASMCAPTSRQSWKTEVRFTWRTASQSSSGNWCAGCRFWMPPQLSRMWILWPSARMAGMRLPMEVLEERSAV